MVLIIDTETSGLQGYPMDRVLEVGIAEFDELSGRISPIYSELIRYDDITEFDSKYLNPDGSKGLWVYRNTDMTVEDTLNAEKDLEAVAEEVRSIVRGKAVTAYNTGFDFGRFLYHEPWGLRWITASAYDIIDLATEKAMRMARYGLIADKGLQERLMAQQLADPGRWVRCQDAYDALCPEDPMGLRSGQKHRALDDALMEGWILKAVFSDMAESPVLPEIATEAR